LHVLTEALRKMTDLDNWVLDVYASANAEEEKRYFAEANRGLEGQLRFRGNFPPDEICRVYEETDVLVTPSLWTENSPLVILFAMRTQTTLVSAEVAGIKEVVGDWGYYYPPNDSSALERLLRRVIAVPAMRNRPGAPHAPDMDENAALVEKIYTEITR
jgi:glycosyltransferase involved in cell wall biosynthesis